MIRPIVVGVVMLPVSVPDDAQCDPATWRRRRPRAAAAVEPGPATIDAAAMADALGISVRTLSRRLPDLPADLQPVSAGGRRVWSTSDVERVRDALRRPPPARPPEPEPIMPTPAPRRPRKARSKAPKLIDRVRGK